MMAHFKITIPTDAGFLGRACKAKNCGQYFKLHQEDREEKMLCPYCGEGFSQSELLTNDQSKHLEKALIAEAEFYAANEFQKMLKQTFGSSSSIRAGFTFKAKPIRKKATRATYSEKKIDSELSCSVCACRFQVHGLFGYCPRCGEDNLKVYDTNWAKIETEVTTSENPNRSLRHAYSDLVSAFEIFCRSREKRLSSTSTHGFQDLHEASRYFRSELSVEILNAIPKENLLALNRVFQKRHVNIHAGGVITDRYVKKIPEDKNLLGKQVGLSLSELRLASEAMRQALLKIITAMEAKG